MWREPAASLLASAVPVEQNDVEVGLVLLVLSYVVGHALHHAGGYLDDYFYDERYVRGRKRVKYNTVLARVDAGERCKDAEARGKWRDSLLAVYPRLPADHERALQYLRELAEPTLMSENPLYARARAELRRTGFDPDHYNVFSWCASSVRVKNADASAELERSGAQSKFFRSLALVIPIAVVGWIVFMASRDIPHAAWISLVAVVGAAGLVVLSLRRYTKLRWYTAELTYEYYLILAESRPAARLDV
jgi:hypothetical protein